VPAYFARFRGSIQHTSTRVENWVNQIAAGEMRIPRFQRDYVWTDAQIIELLESLLRGDYVGSVLLWERYGLPASSERFGEVTVQSPAGQASYVIDGQQRLSALVTAFRSGRFYFDVLEGVFTQAPGPWQFPLTIAFDGFDWLDWHSAHAEEHGLERTKVLDCTSGAYSMLSDMQLSGILLNHRWTRERVVETFERINSTGTPISPEELRAALARAEEP
jgi:hypothetical protein